MSSAGHSEVGWVDSMSGIFAQRLAQNIMILSIATVTKKIDHIICFLACDRGQGANMDL